MLSRFNKVQLKYAQMFKLTVDHSINVLCSKKEIRCNGWGFYKLRRCGQSFKWRASAAQGVM